MPWFIESSEELTDFEKKIEEAKKLRTQTSEEYQKIKRRLEDAFRQIEQFLQVQSEKGANPSDPPVGITEIKALLEKLKELLLGKRISPRIKDLLDTILRNLDSTNPTEYRVLEKFVKDIYKPILQTSLGRWHEEESDEACLEMILSDIIERGLKKIG